ncbi:MAG: hypothetical protein ACI9MS_002262, partial [Glaciecola sp.]
MINPSLDVGALANEFKTDRRLMVKHFLQADIAERARSACMQHVPFSTHYVLNNMYQSKTAEEMAKLNQQD